MSVGCQTSAANVAARAQGTPLSHIEGAKLASASVVIATRSRPQLLERCLEAVAGQHVPPLELIVIDNTRGEEATQKVALDAGARYIVEPIAGLGRARNRGARASAAEVVAYLDDDAVPEPDWLSALLSEFSDPLVAAVAGQILASGPGSDDSSTAELVSFGGPHRIVFDRRSPKWFERANFGGIGQGANMSIRSSVFAKWPGFDERLGRGTRVGTVGLEEHYAFFSLINCGFRVVYTPRARVRHPFPRTEAQLRARQLTQHKAAGFLLALLLTEEPRYWRQSIAYAIESLTGRKRAWRTAMELPETPIPRWRTIRAQLVGVAIYARARLSSAAFSKTGVFGSRRV